MNKLNRFKKRKFETMTIPEGDTYGTIFIIIFCLVAAWIMCGSNHDNGTWTLTCDCGETDFGETDFEETTENYICENCGTKYKK